jgi:hypothetical protein
MKPPSYPADPTNDFATPNANAAGEPEFISLGQRLATWLKHFALYLGAVATACAFGLYFLWRIPIPQDAAQLFKSGGDLPRSRSLSAMVASPVAPAKPAKPQTAAPLPFATPITAGQPAVEATPSPQAATDPNAAPDGSSVPPAPGAEVPAEEAVPPTPQTEIAQLLAGAEQQIENRRLTAPASGNALRSYQRILELETNNTAALEGIERIAAYYRDIAEQTRQQGRFEESLAYIGRGLQASPKNERLLSLRREVRLAKQQEQAQRQARAEAARREQAERDEQNPLRQPVLPAPQPWWQEPAPSSSDSGFNQR